MKNLKDKLFYRPLYLATSSSFVSYCQENGIRISVAELENLHKKGLLYPTLKIYRGIVPMKKILAKFDDKDEWRFVDPKDVRKFKPKKVAKKDYYISGSFYIRGNEWLDYYIKNRMAAYPNLEKFKPWVNSQCSDFTTNKKQIEKYCEYFYEKLQILPLKIILKQFKRWNAFAYKPTKKDKENLKTEVNKINEFIKLYIELEKFYEEAIKFKEDKISELKINITNKKQLKEKWLEEYYFSLEPALKIRTKEIQKEFKIDADELKKRTSYLSEQNIFAESDRSRNINYEYLKGISENTLINAEYVNYMIFIINFYLRYLTGDDYTVKQIILDSVGRQCSICGRTFKPTAKQKYTCADKECQRQYKNNLKRQYRKNGSLKLSTNGT